MGYRVHAFDPAADCPAGQVADLELNRPYDDVDAARAFAEGVDVVTFEFENVPAETLSAVERVRPVRPSPHALHTCRHRLREKTFLKENNIPHADWRECHSAADVADAITTFGGGILKTALFGYDGKGQYRLSDSSEADAAWRKLGQETGIVEALVPFDYEASAIVARGMDGETVVFPIGRNDHINGILDVTVVPGVPSDIEARAAELARTIAAALGIVGLLAVELFVVGNEILVNELAPRPHNSGHWTFDACITSQFEQQLRAVCGLPLGDVTLTGNGVAMANLLGDLWQHGEPDWPAALRWPNVKLHLYGKVDARPGRKMGHLVAIADTPQQAKADVLAARDALSSGK